MEIEQRLEVVYEKTRKDPEYVKYLNKVIMLGKNIMDLLGPHKAIFLEYESLIGLSNNIKLENAYQLGLENSEPLTQVPESCPTKCLTKT